MRRRVNFEIPSGIGPMRLLSERSMRKSRVRDDISVGIDPDKSLPERYMSLRFVQLTRGKTVPLRRLSRRSRMRSWSREERESRGPRRLREGRERPVTRLLVHWTPAQGTEQAVE